MQLSTTYSSFSHSAASTTEHSFRWSTTLSHHRGREDRSVELCIRSIIFIHKGSFSVRPCCVHVSGFPLRMGPPSLVSHTPDSLLKLHIVFGVETSCCLPPIFSLLPSLVLLHGNQLGLLGHPSRAGPSLSAPKMVPFLAPAP